MKRRLGDPQSLRSLYLRKAYVVCESERLQFIDGEHYLFEGCKWDSSGFVIGCPWFFTDKPVFSWPWHVMNLYS